VIDTDHLQAAWGLGFGGITGCVDRGSERNRLAEFAAIHSAALVVFDQISDESFHAGALLD
jgi:hypothetical protein